MSRILSANIRLIDMTRVIPNRPVIARFAGRTFLLSRPSSKLVKQAVWPNSQSYWLVTFCGILAAIKLIDADFDAASGYRYT